MYGAKHATLVASHKTTTERDSMSKTHGTRYAYTTGCRCDECRKANNTYMGHYRRDKPKGSTPNGWRNNRTWEPWEDELALDYTNPAWKIADMLQRTPAAVSTRRRALIARRINKKEEEK